MSVWKAAKKSISKEGNRHFENFGTDTFGCMWPHASNPANKSLLVQWRAAVGNAVGPQAVSASGPLWTCTSVFNRSDIGIADSGPTAVLCVSTTVCPSPAPAQGACPHTEIAPPRQALAWAHLLKSS